MVEIQGKRWWKVPLLLKEMKEAMQLLVEKRERERKEKKSVSLRHTKSKICQPLALLELSTQISNCRGP